MANLLSNTQQLARVGLLLLAGLWWLTPQPVYAGSCNPDYLSGYCEWITAIWDGPSSSCGGQDELEMELCAHVICQQQCAGALADDGSGFSCSSNQWSSWYGFRCEIQIEG